MERAIRALGLVLALTGGAGCRGPDWYADRSPAEIAAMVEVEPAPGPGEAAYLAPTIASSHHYRLAGRRDLSSGRTSHALRLSEFGSAEDRYPDWARASAERRACRLRDARLAGDLEAAADPTSFATVDERTSCVPRRDCETTERTYKKRYKDEDGDTKTKLVERVVRDCRDLWRCQSERLYDVRLGDRALRAASLRPEGLQLELRWDCERRGEPREVLALPLAYLQGYLLAVDGHLAGSKAAE